MIGEIPGLTVLIYEACPSMNEIITAAVSISMKARFGYNYDKTTSVGVNELTY